MRLEVMERLPAVEPQLLRNGGDMVVRRDYDVTGFHDEYIQRMQARAATAPLPRTPPLYDVTPPWETPKGIGPTWTSPTTYLDSGWD